MYIRVYTGVWLCECGYVGYVFMRNLCTPVWCDVENCTHAIRPQVLDSVHIKASSLIPSPTYLEASRDPGRVLRFNSEQHRQDLSSQILYFHGRRDSSLKQKKVTENNFLCQQMQGGTSSFHDSMDQNSFSHFSRLGKKGPRVRLGKDTESLSHS